MSLLFDTYQNNKLKSNLEFIKNNKKNILINKNILNEIKDIFFEKFHKEYIYFFINLFIEPIIFYKEINNIIEYIPIYDFSFLEYIFLDKSNHQKIEYKINIMYEYNYILVENPYFIPFDTDKYNYILEYINNLFEKEINNIETEKINNIEKNESNNLYGGDTQNKEIKPENKLSTELKEKLKKNIYFQTYLFSDLVHDFSSSDRSFLSIENMNKFKDIIQNKFKINILNETTFFKKIRNELLLTNLLHNEYKICKNDKTVGLEFYKLLKKIVQIKEYYIINEASGISFFHLSKDNFVKIMKRLKVNIVKSVGVYIDPYSKKKKIQTNQNITSIYEEEVYYNKICKEIFEEDYFNDIYLRVDELTNNLFDVEGDYTYNLLEKNANSVTNLSIFIEYISTTLSIETIIKNKLYKKYSNVQHEEFENEYKNIYDNYCDNDLDFQQLFLSSITSILLNNQHLFKLQYGENIKNIIISYLLKIKYKNNIHNDIMSELKNKKIRKDINKYFNSIVIPPEISYLFEDEEYDYYTRLFFNIHLDKNKLFFKIILFFTRFKLAGDLFQLIEVDHSFVEYRNKEFKNKNGFLITNDRNLGSYSSTHEKTNYICKNKIKKEIYLFYRIQNYFI